MAATPAHETEAEGTPLLPSDHASDHSYHALTAVEEYRSSHDGTKFDPGDVDADVIPETSVMGRQLSWQSAYILTISRVLGSGIFATPGVILAAVGSPGMSLTLWIVGAILAYCSLTVALEYGCMLPRSGGEKVYLEFTYRRPKYLASVLIATQAIVLGFTASNAIVFAQYLLFAFQTEGTEALRKLLAVGLLTVVTIIHACFKNVGVRIQNFLGWIKILMVVFMILSGLFVVLIRSKDPKDPERNASLDPAGLDWPGSGLWDGTVWAWSPIAISILKVFYSFAGLDNVTNVMNEVKNPVRTLKSVALSALVTATALYLLVNIAFFIVLPIEEIKSSGELIAGLFFERVFGASFGRVFLPLMVALGAAGNVMVVTFALARLNQEIARTGLIPLSRILSSTAPFGSPLGGLLVHYIPSVLVITIPVGDVYSFILEVEGYPAQLLSFATCFGLIWLRFREPDLRRPYRAFIPGVLVRMAMSVALIIAPFFPSEDQRSRGGLWGAGYAVAGLSILAFGVLYWYVWTIALPWWQGYTLDEESETLKDGTTITKLIRKPR